MNLFYLVTRWYLQNIILVYYCNRLQVYVLCVLKSVLPHGLQKTLLKLGFCSGSSSSCDAKVKANQMARKEGKEGKSLVCAES